MDSAVALLPLVGAIALASLWGLSVVPRDARFPIRFGGFGFQTTVSRGTALLLWPVLAVIVFGGVALVGDDQSGTEVFLVGALALVIMLVAQVASIRKASRA